MPSVTYEIATGEIVCVCHAPYDPAMTAPRGYAVAKCKVVIDAESHRVSANGRIIKKRSKDIDAQEMAKAKRQMRSKRAALLTQSDWTQMPDAPVDQVAWREYRQALRDLPANTPDPRNIDWPEAPK